MKQLYHKKLTKPYVLSRTRIENFLKCPRCFYLQEKYGINPPSLPGFSLNSAVDELLKKEFDRHRAQGTPHPLMKKYGIAAIPAPHKELELWRNNFKGIRVIHQPTNFELFGALDDLWINQNNEYYVVDYKATATNKEISLEDEYKQNYKLQAEFYQWLLRQRGLKVSDIAYFIFCNGKKDKETFNGRLEFELTILEHKGDTSWVEPTLMKIKECLNSEEIPPPSEKCELCQYVKAEKFYTYKKASLPKIF
jgi:CRISPR/Cas system-associated exonuclease Cas4 (RecB family)